MPKGPLHLLFRLHCCHNTGPASHTQSQDDGISKRIISLTIAMRFRDLNILKISCLRSQYWTYHIDYYSKKENVTSRDVVSLPCMRFRAWQQIESPFNFPPFLANILSVGPLFWLHSSKTVTCFLVDARAYPITSFGD